MADEIERCINAVLARWNPLEVPADLANEEYTPFVIGLVQAGPDHAKIKSQLVAMLTDILGLSYDDQDANQRNSVEQVAIEILHVLQG